MFQRQKIPESRSLNKSASNYTSSNLSSNRLQKLLGECNNESGLPQSYQPKANQKISNSSNIGQKQDLIPRFNLNGQSQFGGTIIQEYRSNSSMSNFQQKSGNQFMNPLAKQLIGEANKGNMGISASFNKDKMYNAGIGNGARLNLTPGKNIQNINQSSFNQSNKQNYSDNYGSNNRQSSGGGRNSQNKFKITADQTYLNFKQSNNSSNSSSLQQNLMQQAGNMGNISRNNQNSNTLNQPRQKQFYQDNEQKFNIPNNKQNSYNDYDLKNDFNRNFIKNKMGGSQSFTGMSTQISQFNKFQQYKQNNPLMNNISGQLMQNPDRNFIRQMANQSENRLTNDLLNKYRQGQHQNQINQTVSQQPTMTKKQMMNDNGFQRFMNDPQLQQKFSQEVNKQSILEQQLLKKSEISNKNRENMMKNKNDKGVINLENNQDEQLNLEVDDSDQEMLGDDSELLFKDQKPKTKNFLDSIIDEGCKPPQPIQKEKLIKDIDDIQETDTFQVPDNQKMMILEVSDDELQELDEIEILSQHLDNDENSIDQQNAQFRDDQYKSILQSLDGSSSELDKKSAEGKFGTKELFAQRNQVSKLDYGGDVFSNVSKNFYNKYFSNTSNASLTGSPQSAQNNIKQLAQTNSFLLQQNRSNTNQNFKNLQQIASKTNEAQTKTITGSAIKGQETQPKGLTKLLNKNSNDNNCKYSSFQTKGGSGGGNLGISIDKLNDLRDKRNYQQAKQTISKKFQKYLNKEQQKKQDELLKREKLKELLRKKRQMEQIQQQEDEIDELFNRNILNKDKDDKKDENTFLNNLEAMKEKDTINEADGLNALMFPPDENKADECSPNLDDANNHLTAEEQELYQQQINRQNEQFLLRQQQEFEEKMRYIRYKNRKNVDELIQPILNLDIVSKYFTLEQDKEINKDSMFPILPLQFENSQQYFDYWVQLFIYETYNQLINKRNESEKDRELSRLYGMKMKNDHSQKSFKGLIQRNKQDLNFIYLKLFEHEQNVQSKDEKTTKQQPNTNYQTLQHISHLKEFDLLLLSEKELDTTNVKQLTNDKFLMDLKKQSGKLMGMVNQKRQMDKNFVEIKVDISHDQYVNLNCSEFEYHVMYIYFFDSMSTRIREFRTIKSAEFYPTAMYILDPTRIPRRTQKEDDTSQISKENKDKEGDQQAEFSPRVSEAKDSKQPPLPLNENQKQQQNFIEKHQHVFNESQYQALVDVTTMKPVDFLLIQGPPGTGKTHTIKGIISMINSCIQNRKKVLVCAPSNAAIDEIVTRLISKGGLIGQNEQTSIRKVLRIGAFDYEPSEIVKKVIFDTKLQQEKQIAGGQIPIESQNEKLIELQRLKWQEEIKNIEKISKMINFSKGDNHTKQENIKKIAESLLQNKNQIDEFMVYEKKRKIQKLTSYKKQVQAKIDIEKHNKHISGSTQQLSKKQRQALERKIIEQTQIICTTLAMSTNEKLDYLNLGDIDYLIVDEACQSVELNNLIPFEHQPSKVILVGDQQQLPATTFSENAERTNYSRSMFERFLCNGVQRIMLEIQYRMDPQIRQFPSDQFYESRLRDADSISMRQKDQKYLDSDISFIRKKFNSVMFFDLEYSQEEACETSKTNYCEAEFIESLIGKFLNLLVENYKNRRNFNFVQQFKKSQGKNIENNDSKEDKMKIMKELKGSIGIISPYKSQVRILKDKVFDHLRQKVGIETPQNFIEINTVDAFQGREKDIIIFSCVRSSAERALGFLSDYRRMNVAITRAKHCLFVIGNSKTLSKDKNWNSLIEYCKVNNYQHHISSYRFLKNKSEPILPPDVKPIETAQKQNENRSKSPIQKNKSQDYQKDSYNNRNRDFKKDKSKDKYRDYTKKDKSKEKSQQISNLRQQINDIKNKDEPQNRNQEKQQINNKNKKSSKQEQKNKPMSKSSEEEGQIFSSGQMADKQTTEADEQAIRSQDIHRTSKQHMHISSIESGELDDKSKSSKNDNKRSKSKSLHKDKNYTKNIQGQVQSTSDNIKVQNTSKDNFSENQSNNQSSISSNRNKMQGGNNNYNNQYRKNQSQWRDDRDQRNQQQYSDIDKSFQRENNKDQYQYNNNYQRGGGNRRDENRQNFDRNNQNYKETYNDRNDRHHQFQGNDSKNRSCSVQKKNYNSDWQKSNDNQGDYCNNNQQKNQNYQRNNNNNKQQEFNDWGNNQENGWNIGQHNRGRLSDHHEYQNFNNQNKNKINYNNQRRSVDRQSYSKDNKMRDDRDFRGSDQNSKKDKCFNDWGQDFENSRNNDRGINYKRNQRESRSKSNLRNNNYPENNNYNNNNFKHYNNQQQYNNHQQFDKNRYNNRYNDNNHNNRSQSPAPRQQQWQRKRDSKDRDKDNNYYNHNNHNRSQQQQHNNHRQQQKNWGYPHNNEQRIYNNNCNQLIGKRSYQDQRRN